MRCHGKFQSTLPGWGATSTTAARTSPESFQSTLPGWGATLEVSVVSWPAYISIHAPRMGSDNADNQGTLDVDNFNPRSPDGERRARENCRSVHECYFNPRSPDGERPSVPACLASSFNFNPRSPDGERPRKWTSSPTIWAKSSIFNTDCIADRR